MSFASDAARTPSAAPSPPGLGFSRIAATGSFLPPGRLTNAELVARLAGRGVETADDWIVERTGIRARHFADDGVMTSDLAVEAARRALEAAGRAPGDIDLVIVATSTPDMVFPSTACIVQAKLGIAGGAAFDVQAVCTGFVYALSIADAMIRTGGARRALVIGAEIFSRILDFDDRTTCVLFGDGAGAVILEACERPGGVAGGQVAGRPLLTMDGQAVFKLAVGVLEDSARAVLERAGRPVDAVDWLIPHQANVRIMQATAKRLRLPAERVIVTVGEHGNTSAASIPLALDAGVRDGRIRAGQTLLLEGVGGGFTWGAVLVDF